MSASSSRAFGTSVARQALSVFTRSDISHDTKQWVDSYLQTLKRYHPEWDQHFNAYEIISPAHFSPRADGSIEDFHVSGVLSRGKPSHHTKRWSNFHLYPGGTLALTNPDVHPRTLKLPGIPEADRISSMQADNLLSQHQNIKQRLEGGARLYRADVAIENHYTRVREPPQHPLGTRYGSRLRWSNSQKHWIIFIDRKNAWYKLFYNKQRQEWQCETEDGVVKLQ